MHTYTAVSSARPLPQRRHDSTTRDLLDAFAAAEGNGSQGAEALYYVSGYLQVDHPELAKHFERVGAEAARAFQHAVIGEVTS